MQELKIPHPNLWATLLPERRRSLILTLERMVFRSVMRAPIIEENSDDERRLRRKGAPEPAALSNQARENSQPPP
jgi:hypothetical protein